MEKQIGLEQSLELLKYRQDLESLLREKTKEIELMMLQSLATMANTIDAKDPYTKGHSFRVAEYAVAIAKKMGFTQEEQQNIRYVALLHDVGKIGIPDEILKKPALHSMDEYEKVKDHTVIGGRILQNLITIENVVEGAMYHHENWDGTGYPEGLKGEEIPLVARIICVADTFDAMTTDRVYRKKLQKEEVRQEFEQGKGKQFDPVITDIFLQMIENGFEPLEEERMAIDGEDILLRLLEEHQSQKKDSLTQMFFFYLESEEGKEGELFHASRLMHRAIHDSIRFADTCLEVTRYESILILTQVDEEDATQIVERIKENYEKRDSENTVLLKYKKLDLDHFKES